MTSPDPDTLPDRAPRRRIGGGARAFLSIAAAGFGVQLLTVASGPLVARMLGPDGRGQMVLVTIVAMLFSLLGVGGLPSAIAHAVGSSGAAARDVLHGLLRLWLTALLVPAVLAGGLMFGLLRDEPHRWTLVAETVALCFGLSLQFILGAMLQGEGNVRLVNLQRLVGMASYVAVVVALFVLAPTDQATVLLFIYALSLIGGFFVCWGMLRRPTGDPALRASRQDVHGFARRGFVSGLNAMDSLGIDQLLVGLVLGQASLGLYAVAVSVTSVPTIVLGGIATILLPRMAALPRGASLALMRKWVAAAVLLDLLMILGIQVVLGPALRIFFGDDFVPATDVARILAVAWGFFALRRVLTAAAQAQGKVATASVAEAVSTVVLVAGALLGMHLHGLEGVGIAMVVSGALFCTWIAVALAWRADDEDDVAPLDPDLDVVDVIELDEGDRLLP